MLPFTRTCTREDKRTNRWLDGAGDKCPSSMKVKCLNGMERGGGAQKGWLHFTETAVINFSALLRERRNVYKKHRQIDLQEEDPKVKKPHSLI